MTIETTRSIYFIWIAYFVKLVRWKNSNNNPKASNIR